MTTIQMRERVKTAYPGPHWKRKVNKMTDEQIIAIYYNLIRLGKIIAG
jgi:hypothetical protein